MELCREPAFVQISPPGTRQLSPSLHGFSGDIHFPNPLPPLCPHSCRSPPLSSAVFLPSGSPPPSYLRPASQVIACPSAQTLPALETCLWLPAAGRILSDLPEIAELRTPGPSPGDPVPRRLTPHASLTSPPHYEPAPTVFPGPQQTSISPTSSLQCPSAPLHTPTPACCPGQILALTCPGSPRALLQAELAFPRGSPVPCAGLFGKSELPVCLLSSEAGLYVPRERPGQTDNSHNPRE